MNDAIAAINTARMRALPPPGIGAARGTGSAAQGGTTARAGRDDAREALSGLPIPATPGRGDDSYGNGRSLGHGQAGGAPVSAFLAQHIAQEVMPEAPGFDAHRAGAQAYLTVRDARNEFSRGFAGLDLHI